MSRAQMNSVKNNRIRPLDLIFVSDAALAQFLESTQFSFLKILNLTHISWIPYDDFNLLLPNICHDFVEFSVKNNRNRLLDLMLFSDAALPQFLESAEFPSMKILVAQLYLYLLGF